MKYTKEITSVIIALCGPMLAILASAYVPVIPRTISHLIGGLAYLFIICAWFFFTFTAASKNIHYAIAVAVGCFIAFSLLLHPFDAARAIRDALATTEE
jgi:hypothetical protein